MYQHHLFHQQFAQGTQTAMVRAALIKHIKNATNIQFVMPTYRLLRNFYLYPKLQVMRLYFLIIIDYVWVVVYVYLGKLP